MLETSHCHPWLFLLRAANSSSSRHLAALGVRPDCPFDTQLPSQCSDPCSDGVLMTPQLDKSWTQSSTGASCSEGADARAAGAPRSPGTIPTCALRRLNPLMVFNPGRVSRSLSVSLALSHFSPILYTRISKHRRGKRTSTVNPLSESIDFAKLLHLFRFMSVRV